MVEAGGLSEGQLVQPPSSSQLKLLASCPGLCPDSFWISLRVETPLYILEKV